MVEARDPQLLKGVLPMLVLAVLDHDESYGYELVGALEALGLDGITTGSVYPVLARLERDGHVTSRLEPSPSGPARKYYRTSPTGRVALEVQHHDFVALAAVVARGLGGEGRDVGTGETRQPGGGPARAGGDA